MKKWHALVLSAFLVLGISGCAQGPTGESQVQEEPGTQDLYDGTGMDTGLGTTDESAGQPGTPEDEQTNQSY